MNRLVLIPIFVLLFTASCSKPGTKIPQGDSEYYVIGKAYGMCQGDCATFYSIKQGNAYADDMTRFYRTENELKFKSSPMAADKYKKIKALSGKIPQYLIDHPNQTFGCPDCADQGLIYIETKINGVIKHWMIDTRTADIPAEIRSYTEEVASTLNQL
jgi:hypothetical protein